MSIVENNRSQSVSQWIMSSSEGTRISWWIYLLWCRGRRSYGPECFALDRPNLVLCWEWPILSVFLLYWYRWISGISFVDVLFTSKSSSLLSSALNLASIACIVNSLLILVDVEAPAASAGISILGLDRSNSSWNGKKSIQWIQAQKIADTIHIHNLYFWPNEQSYFCFQSAFHSFCWWLSSQISPEMEDCY